ncbi:hypothetical protein pb186bvf_014949 [Paramecium bursaria]
MDREGIVQIRDVVDALFAEQANQLLRKSKLFGIIIDVSRPKRHASGDFMQMVKLIDETFDGYLTLFFFYKSLNDIAPLDTIGDIVYLKRFQYLLFNNNPQTRHNQYKTSQFLLFDHQSNTADLGLKYNPQESRSLNALEIQSLNSIRQYAYQRFVQKSLLENFWYGPDQHPFYDVIFKVKELNEQKNIFYDQNGQEFTLVSQVISESQLPPDSTVKLRNVQIHLDNKIQVNDLTSILRIPDYYYDHVNYENINQQIVKVDKTQEQFIKLNEESVTQIKAKYQQLGKTQAKQILDSKAQDKCVYHIYAEIVGIRPPTLHEALIFYNDHQSYSYKEALANKLNISNLDSTLQFQIQITDKSLVEGQFLSAIGFKNYDLFTFGEVNAANVDSQNQKYQQILEKLLLAEESIQGDFIIEQYKINNQQINRVVDTQIHI